MLWLEVRTGNQRARALYRRYGFAEIGVRRNYYPAPRGEPRGCDRDEPADAAPSACGSLRMGWTEQQRRMLAEMGLPAWLAPLQAGDAAAARPGRVGGRRRGGAVTAVAAPEPAAGAGRRSGAGGPIRSRRAAAAAGERPVRAAPAATAAPGWDELRAVVVRLHRLRPVPGPHPDGIRRRRPTRARWLIVGDAPRETGGPQRRAVRRAQRAAARQHAARAAA